MWIFAGACWTLWGIQFMIKDQAWDNTLLAVGYITAACSISAAIASIVCHERALRAERNAGAQ
jgi:hypothetical protein